MNGRELEFPFHQLGNGEKQGGHDEKSEESHRILANEGKVNERERRMGPQIAT
jgi:hypothetical protein